MKVIVGSKNPVKIMAVKNAFNKMFSDQMIEVEGVISDSRVSEMPMNRDETYQGAYNRAYGCSLEYDADFYVGLEGGCEIFNEELGVTGWVVVISKDGKIGKGSAGIHFLPPKVVELIYKGYELGVADDMVFGTHNSKQDGGSIGILTGGAIMREEGFMHAVINALIPHKNRKLYEGSN